jgi:hypothetical protein
MFDQMKSLIESLRFDIQSKDLSITNLKSQFLLKEESLTHDIVKATHNYEEIQEKLKKFEEKTRKNAESASQKSFQSIQSLQKDVSESKLLIEKWKQSFYDLELSYNSLKSSLSQTEEENSQQLDDLKKECGVKLKNQNEIFIKQFIEIKNGLNSMTNELKKISTLFGKLGSKERHIGVLPGNDENTTGNHRKENHHDNEEEILDEITKILTSLKTEHRFSSSLDNNALSLDTSSSSFARLLSSSSQGINEEYTRLIKHLSSFVQRVLSIRNHHLQTVMSLKEKTISYDSMISTAFTEVETKVSAISQDIETSDMVVNQLIEILERNGLLSLKKGNGSDHHSHSHGHAGSSSFIPNEAFNDLKTFHSKVIAPLISLFCLRCLSFFLVISLLASSPLLTSPHLTSPLLSSPLLSSPLLSSPLLSSPLLSSPLGWNL